MLVFDTETTGLSTATDRVVQLGAAYWRGGAQLGPPRGMLVDPGEGWGGLGLGLGLGLWLGLG